MEHFEIPPEEYAWNDYERNLYLEGKIQIPSPYKLKITDVLEERMTLEKTLERLPQGKLAVWAIKNADRFIHIINIGNDPLKDTIVTQAKKALEDRRQGIITANELRKVGFLTNDLCKLSICEESKLASRIFVQAIAVGHMRGHAIISSDYAIKLCNLQHNKDNEAIRIERKEQIAIANSIIKTIS